MYRYLQTTYKQLQDDTTGMPPVVVVWQQQMEYAYIKTSKIVQIDRPDRYLDFHYTADFETQICPLQMIEDCKSDYLTRNMEKSVMGRFLI